MLLEFWRENKSRKKKINPGLVKLEYYATHMFHIIVIFVKQHKVVFRLKLLNCCDAYKESSLEI